MSEHEKKLVSFSRFVELLNEELMSLPTYEEGMLFVDVGSAMISVLRCSRSRRSPHSTSMCSTSYRKTIRSARRRAK